MKTVADYLMHYRTTLGYTMVEMQNKTGLSNTYINDIEKGRKIPPYSTLAKLMEALMLTQEQKQELIEVTNQERVKNKTSKENKKMSEMSKMTSEQIDKSLDSLREQLPGIPIKFVDKASIDVDKMTEEEVNKKLSDVTIAFNAFNKLSFEEKKIILTLFNDSMKGN